MSLPEFLGDDLERRIRIQKAMAQNLALRLGSAAIIGLGAGFFRRQGGEAALLEGSQDLVITLATITIFLSDGADLSFQTLAFDEHEETAGEFIVGGDGEGARWASKVVCIGIELEGIHTDKNSEGRAMCLIKCGGQLRPRFE